MVGFGWTASCPKFFQQFQISADPSNPNDFSNNNLISISNEYCYVWNPQKNIIVRGLCAEIFDSRKDEASSGDPNYLEYSVSSLPFVPTQLSARKSPNCESEILLLWGSGGVAVVTLPKVTHQQILAQTTIGGPIAASCNIIGAKVYLEHTRLSALQVKWHPYTGRDIVVILNNDNFLRFYLLSDSYAKPLFSVCAGPSSSKPFQYTNYSVGLIEIPIDFDFGPELPTADCILVFILENTGELSYVLISKNMVHPHRFHRGNDQKKISFDSSIAEDNIEDATTILVSKSFPVIVIIGCVSGKLHHAVLLPSFDSSASAPGVDKTNLSMEESVLNGDVSLFVKETLEIQTENDEVGLNFIKLMPDPLFSHRYACIHGEGIHIVKINFASAMGKYFTSDPGKKLEHEQQLPDETGAEVRFILRSKLSESGQNGSYFAFSDTIPQKFIMFLRQHGAIVYEIPHLLDFDTLFHSPNRSMESRVEKIAVEDMKPEETLQAILKKSSNQPLLLRESKDLQGKEASELQQILKESLSSLQREYIQKQEVAASYLVNSLQTIAMDTREMGDCIEKINKAVLSDINKCTQSISGSHKIFALTQDEMQKRIEDIEDSRQEVLPMLTDEEKHCNSALEKLEGEVELVKSSLHELRLKITNPLLQGGVHAVEFHQAEFSDSQLKEIKQSVQQQQQDLTTLRSTVQELCSKLNVN